MPRESDSVEEVVGYYVENHGIDATTDVGGNEYIVQIAVGNLWLNVEYILEDGKYYLNEDDMDESDIQSL